MKINNITEFIGNTPILEINPSITGLKNIKLFCKCEFLNPFGSLKDRPAYYMLKDKIASLHGKQVIEASSGNTAKAMSIICAMNNIPFKTVTNRIKVPEVKDILKILGTEIEELPGMSECPDPTDLKNNALAYIDNIISQNPNAFYNPNQYINNNNPKAHFENTGKEIYNDIGNVDLFFGTLGTTGSTRGTIEYLLTQNKNLKTIGIVASKSDFIPGIRNADEMYEVGIFKKDLYNEILTINSNEAIDGMLILNKKLGLLAGPTSGAAYMATLKYLKELDCNLTSSQTAVFLACDRMEWYISYIKKRRPELFSIETVKNSVRNIKAEDLHFAKTIAVNEIENFINQKHPMIIDVRGNLAYKNGHIKNSINITDMFFEDIVDNGIPFSKNDIVLFVCAVGDKSMKYSAFLNKKGLNTYSLSGGMVEYRDNNLELERNIEKFNLL